LKCLNRLIELNVNVTKPLPLEVLDNRPLNDWSDF
jgi:hypothetical protein